MEITWVYLAEIIHCVILDSGCLFKTIERVVYYNENRHSVHCVHLDNAVSS